MNVELSGNLILLDEGPAREMARKLGLNYIGSVGSLVLAKRLGVIEEIKPVLDKIIKESKFWLNKELYKAVLKNNGEL